MNKKVTITIVLLVITAYSIGMYFAIKQSNKCDERVYLTDGTIIDCKNTSSYDSGITYIKTCDGETIKVPTINIKIIKQINYGNAAE